MIHEQYIRDHHKNNSPFPTQLQKRSGKRALTLKGWPSQALGPDGPTLIAFTFLYIGISILLYSQILIWKKLFYSKAYVRSCKKIKLMLEFKLGRINQRSYGRIIIKMRPRKLLCEVNKLSLLTLEVIIYNLWNLILIIFFP